MQVAPVTVVTDLQNECQTAKQLVLKLLRTAKWGRFRLDAE